MSSAVVLLGKHGTKAIPSGLLLYTEMDLSASWEGFLFVVDPGLVSVLGHGWIVFFPSLPQGSGSSHGGGQWDCGIQRW